MTMIKSSSPLVNISASVGHGAYALGYQTAFDAGIATCAKFKLFQSIFLGNKPVSMVGIIEQILCISMMDKLFVSLSTQTMKHPNIMRGYLRHPISYHQPN